jgi:hypothetical protein
VSVGKHSVALQVGNIEIMRDAAKHGIDNRPAFVLSFFLGVVLT